MASQYVRLLDPRVIQANDVQDLKDAFDGGAYTKLELHCRILKSGSAGNVKLQHAAVNDEDGYIDLGNASWAANGSGGPVSISNFLRYVRWVGDSAVAGNPVVTIDLIAKE